MTVNVQKRRRRYYIKRAYLPRENRSTVRSIRANRSSKTISMVISASAGIFLGAYVYSPEYAERISAAVSGASEGGFFSLTADFFTGMMIYVLLLFFCGTSSAGSPVAYALTFFKGTGAGAIAAYFCGQAGNIESSELIRRLAAVMPVTVLSSALVVLAASQAVQMSALTAQRTFGSCESSDGKSDRRLYMLKFAAITGLCLASAPICSGAACLFSGT